MTSKLDSVYVTYWSLRDPLCQSQSLPVLRFLARRGWRLGLLSFEQPQWALDAAAEVRMREALAAEGILWEPLVYHKRPPVLSTLWDIAIGVWRGCRLARWTGARLFHGRSSVSAAIAYLVSRFARTAFLNDADGPLSQEYVDAGVWKAQSLPHLLTGWAEELFLRQADAVAVLTERRRLEVRHLARSEVVILPCAVDVDHFVPDPRARESLRRELDLVGTVLVYAGKAGGWYLTESMLDFVAVARDVLGELTLLLLTWEPEERFSVPARKRGLRCAIRSASREEMPAYLSAADAGLSFVMPGPSKTACSPVKNGEYLACGLPIVTTRDIGDYSNLVREKRVGVVVESLDGEGYRRAAEELRRLRDDPQLSLRCRETARSEVGLEEVVLPRYFGLYERLLGAPAATAVE